MKKIKYLLLFVTLLILLVGVASATEVSDDVTDVDSITKEAVTQDTYKVSGTANNMQENIVDKDIQASKSSDNKLGENTTKTIAKNTKSNLKTDAIVTNWEELRSAVKNAQGLTIVTINLRNGTYKTNDPIIFNNSVTIIIEGNGQTIDGNKQQVFIVQKGEVAIHDITIKNAASKDGAAIYNRGLLTITQSTFTNNTADNKTGCGGAIYNRGLLEVKKSTFADNRAVSGGAIHNGNDGRVIITTCTFTNNTGNYNSNGCSGGAIANHNGYVEVTDSTLTNNGAFAGGAIDSYDELKIKRSTFTNNNATWSGGAIQGSNKKIMVYNSIFTNNKAIMGGAIYAKGNLTLEGNKFTDNRAPITHETIEISEKTNQLYNNVYNSTDISLKKVILSLEDDKNTYYYGESVELKYYIELEHPDYYDKYVPSNLNDITLYINGEKKFTTHYNHYTLSNLTPGDYEVYFNSCRHKSNTVKFTVKPITNWQELTEAVKYAENQTKNVNIKLDNGNYTNTNTINWTNRNIVLTIDGNGQTIDGNQLQVFNINSRSSMILRNITIINAKSDDGGAIKNKGILTITQSTLANNTAEYGGVIENTGTLTITKSTLTGNTAHRDGGAINNLFNLNITESTLSNNTAGWYGGAIRNLQYDFNIVDSNFTNNHADRAGAIYSSGYRNLTGNTFINNTVDDMETIFLTGALGGRVEDNVYKYNDISLKNITLRIKDNKNTFTPFEDVVLNFTIGLKNPQFYDKDILEELEDITIYVNGREYATTKYENYTLSNLTPGDYTVYITTCNQKSKNVTFKVITAESKITTPENSYDYQEGIPDTITLNIIDPSGKKGTAIITVKDDSEYRQLLSLTDITDGYELSTESIVNALENIYDNLDDSYTINITYSNDYVTPSSTEFTLNIIKQANVNISTQTTPTHLIVTVKDDKENPINHGTITTNITSSNYYPDDNGQVFIALDDLEPGKYMAKINYAYGSQKDVSDNVTFSVYSENDMINVTTSNVEMVNGKGVTFDAYVDYKNRTIKYGKVYFEIDGKPLVDEDGLVLYAPVKDNWASLPYEIPKDLSLGNHTLTAVYIASTSIWTTDEKTLTIIENIPEGASDEGQNPQEDEKQETYKKDTRAHKTITYTIQSNIPAIHQIIIDNIVIPADTVITLGELNEIFNQTFANGHLLLYIDGQLVYNGTLGDDLATVILEIIEKFLGEHELKVEFTDSNNQTQTYTKNVTIT